MNELKEMSDYMSFVEKLSKDKARNILFFTSLSVILITLGIIQTLLFETITFFSEIASERGWFTFTIALGDISQPKVWLSYYLCC